MDNNKKCVRCIREIQPSDGYCDAMDYIEELLEEGFDVANMDEEDALCAECADEVI